MRAEPDKLKAGVVGLAINQNEIDRIWQSR
jgi:hypothetical protein